MNLVSELRPYISPGQSHFITGHCVREKKVAVALYFLKDTGSLRTINSFEIALNTALAAVSEVCQAIPNYLGPKYLHLPENEESMREKVAVLSKIWNDTSF